MRNKVDHYSKLLFLALISIAVIIVMSCKKSLVSEIKIDITTAQNASIKADVKRSSDENERKYDIQLSNTTGQNQNLKTINIIFSPENLIPDGTPYMLGADGTKSPESQMIQRKTGTQDENDYSTMYVMFKRGEANYLLVGVISWRTFLCKISTLKGAVKISGQGDNKLISAGKDVAFEKIVCLKSTSSQDILDKYADLIVIENHVKTPMEVAWKGWSTWDYYLRNYINEDVDKNVKAIEDLQVKPNLIQIDGGWWKQRGDYFDARDNLSGGIKGMIEKIHKAGYKAGLHFDGFRAAKEATIVRDHPDYFLHTENGSFVGMDPDSKNSIVIWDYSNPGATDYIRSVMKNARENWGVDYFKIDFMRDGLIEGVSYLPVTNLERFRMGMNAIREGMGSDTYMLASMSSFGTVIGIANAARVGADIDPNYNAVKRRATHTSASYYFHRKIYNVDPDYVVLRAKEETDKKGAKMASLTFDQAAMWINYVSIYGSTRLESDDITLLSPEKKKLIQKGFGMPFFDKTIPMDMWDHYKTVQDAPNFYLAKTSNGVICLGLFNWEDRDASFIISGFKQDASFSEFNGMTKMASKNGKITVPLKGTHSILLQYEGNESFDILRKQLKLTFDSAN